MCDLTESTLVVISVLIVISLVTLWNTHDLNVDKKIEGILKKHSGCFNWNDNRCFQNYKARQEQVVDEDTQCLLITVYLKCIFNGCNIHQANIRKRFSNELLKDLEHIKIECDIKYNNYRAMCTYHEDECIRQLKKKIRTQENGVCRHYGEFFKCFFTGCPKTDKQKLEIIRNKENQLSENNYNCDFEYKEQLYPIKECTDKNNLFKCSSGECIHKDFICNGEYNCKDKSDEQFCEFYPKLSRTFSKKKQRNPEL